MEKGEFILKLGKLRRNWQAGLLVSAALRLLGHVAVALAVFGLLDFFLAFELSVCLVIDIVLLAVIGGLFAKWVTGIARLHESDAARYADRLLKSARRSVLGAFEINRWLGRNRGSLPDFQVYLSERSIEQASAELRRLTFRDYFPLGVIGRQAKILFLQVCIAGLIAALNGGAAKVILTRILLPLRDTPPYTEYVFKVTPAEPKVIYGGNAEISVDITGAPVKSQVIFYTRYRGKKHKTVCFQESAQHFAQRLEKVVSPVEFCFGTGKGRSRWQKVNLLIQPQIASASVTITPPAYAGLPKREFQAGKEEISGYRKSKVGLFLTSNRPLSGGVLTIEPKSGLRGSRQVEGTRIASDTIGFNWSLEEDAVLDVVITDISGTKNRDQFRMEQRMMPDKPPEVSITEPAGFCLATPKTAVPFSGYASDDLGLRKVELVRTVVGYRDRALHIGPDISQSKFNFEKKLELKNLGIEPGQILEFYIEAADNNPDLTGISMSEVVRVRIISEQEYAVMMRARSTLRDFISRYQVARETVDRFKKSLEELKQAVKSQKKEDLEAKLEAARKAARSAASQLEKMSNDFALYDMEKSLEAKMANSADKVRQQSQRLEQAASPYAGLQDMVQEMMDELGIEEQGFEQEGLRADQVAGIASVMELAAKFKELVRQQTEIVRWLERFSLESKGKDAKTLASLGARQDEIRAELVKFNKNLRDRAAELPDFCSELQKSAQDFAAAVEKLEISDLMQKTVKSSENEDGKQTFQFATLALEKMKELMSKSGQENSPFGGMVEQKMTFQVNEDLKSTLQQMMESLFSGGNKGGQPGQQPGSAGGGMVGGDVNDGYWTGGNSPLNVPMFGPERGTYQSSQDAGLAGGGSGRGSRPDNSQVRHTSETMGLSETTMTSKQVRPAEAVPEKYRDAIKKYFSTMEEKQ